MKLKYFLFFLLSSFSAFSQDDTEIIFKENYVDSTDKKIDSILLLGFGTSTTRMFLDDLSQYLIKNLSEDNIVTKYYYIGKNLSEAQYGYDTISKKGFKAILFFLPEDVAFFDIQSNRTQIRIGPVTPTIATSTLNFEQGFDFSLYSPSNNMKKIWSASVEVSCDISKSKYANEAGIKLLNYFKKNKYIK